MFMKAFMIKFQAEKAIKFLNEKLKLPVTGVEQDWDLELSDSDRLVEFLSFYENQRLDADTKFALMSLIIASYENVESDTNYIENNNNPLWERICAILQNDKKIHEHTIHSWCYWDYENREDASLVSSKMRAFFLQNSNQFISPEDFLKIQNIEDCQTVYYW
ncbi:MAG: hypothetical protein DHS20C07_00090 [Methyloligella sp.]|nr:MAG: hypothetical protein DHS20C07_00090 [Methyloligella sp.]